MSPILNPLSTLNFILTRLFGARMPSSYHVIGFLLQAMFAAVIRFAYRFYILLIRQQRNNRNKTNVMLIGAGDAGLTILRDINKNMNVRGWGRAGGGVYVRGGRALSQGTRTRQLAGNS